MFKVKTLQKISYILILLVVVISISGCSSNEKGKPAADFTLPDLNGTNISLSQYKGQNVFLNFWASWCGPCIEEMPDIQKVHDEYKDKGLVVLTINPGDEKDAIQSLMTQNNYTFPVLVDKERSVAKAYNTSNIPVTFLINKEGVIVYKKVGLMTGDEMKTAISQLQ